MKKLILVLLLCIPCYGIEKDKALHIGVSYALQTATYSLSKNALGLDKTDAIVFSAFTTFLFSTAYKAACSGLGPNESKRDIGANLIGQALSIGTILTFDF